MGCLSPCKYCFTYASDVQPLGREASVKVLPRTQNGRESVTGRHKKPRLRGQGMKLLYADGLLVIIVHLVEVARQTHRLLEALKVVFLSVRDLQQTQNLCASLFQLL